MRLFARSALLFFGLWNFITTDAIAMVFRLGTQSGFMQQPTSQYYHAIYGGYFDVAAFDDLKFIMRGSYFERPKFNSQGYVDQEYGAFGFIGRQIKGSKSWGIVALAGYGRILGYLTPITGSMASGETRKFSMPGPTVSLEISYRLKFFEVALGHQSFVGYGDKEQFAAYVAWPYSFFTINLGTIL